MQSMAAARQCSSATSVEVTSEEPCLNVEEQIIVDSEVLVHGGDLIQPAPSAESPIPVPVDEQSVAVVEASAPAARALVWAAYGRPAFYVGPAAVFSGVPTAVVAPIKRETPDSGVIHRSTTSQSAVEGPAAAQAAPPLSKAHLPPFETFRAPAISGGSSATMTSSASVSAGDAAAMNLCVATRSAAKLEVDPLPPTSFYGHPGVTSSFPFPVWSLPTVALPAEGGTRARGSSQCGAADQLVASTPLKVEAGHVAVHSLPVQQIPPFTAAEVIASASRRPLPNNGSAPS